MSTESQRPRIPTSEDQSPGAIPKNPERLSRRTVDKASRQPFGSLSQKLAYEDRPGYHRHWFNDVPGRLEDAEKAGYKFVEDKEGRKVSRPVGPSETGTALIAYLMEIPEEWYNEDMAAQQVQVNKFDAAMRRGNVEGTVGQDGRYIPRQGITVKDSR